MFKLSAPGTNPSRQEAPHPHEVILDPTGSIIVVPDLGADLIRVFNIDLKTSLLTESTPFPVSAGSGPRHGTFLKTDSGKTFFFLISELANTIASYEVEYSTAGLNFTNVFLSGTYGNRTTPVGAAAAEAILSVSLKTHFYFKEKSEMLMYRPEAGQQIPSYFLTQRHALPTRQLRQDEQHQDPLGHIAFLGY
jgi:Lactonase, 7-bladed beta-propeller